MLEVEAGQERWGSDGLHINAEPALHGLRLHAEPAVHGVRLHADAEAHAAAQHSLPAARGLWPPDAGAAGVVGGGGSMQAGGVGCGVGVYSNDGMHVQARAMTRLVVAATHRDALAPTSAAASATTSTGDACPRSSASAHARATHPTPANSANPARHMVAAKLQQAPAMAPAHDLYALVSPRLVSAGSQAGRGRRGAPPRRRSIVGGGGDGIVGGRRLDTARLSDSYIAQCL